MNAEVRVNPAQPACDFSAYYRITAEVVFGQFVLIQLCLGQRQHLDMVGDQDFTGQRLQPVPRHRFKCSNTKQVPDAACRHKEPVAGKLGVAFPLQPERAKISAEVIAALRRWRHTKALAQVSQRCHVQFAKQYHIG